ncbi:hypothetical protein LTR66_009935 [Elasticomyces elasticus]|nr:hypothetical protein LTR66_009935 [Elasticomyces elasticus]
MATVLEAPQQFRQPSRKGKRAWRKHVDVTDVQHGLESVRDEVTKGGVIAEKDSSLLFTTDATGSSTIRDAVAKKHKSLKADEILATRSAIPAIDSRKRKTADGIVVSSSKRSKNGTYVPHKELQRLKNIAFGGDAKQIEVVLAENVDHDPWAVQPPKQDPRFSFLEEKQPVKAPATLKEQPISQTVSGRAVPAVPKPNAGRSYNPDFTAWDELVTREGDKEVEAERKRLADAQADEARTNAALAEAARPEPSSDNDAEYESAWESEWEGIQSEAEAEANLKKKRPERKTQADRNKLKRRKEAERTALHEKQMKRREEQQKRIREISKAVAKEEMARRGQLAALQTVTGADSSADEDEEEVLRRRKFGKIHIPPAPLALVLADELQDSLRALRPEGNLLRDRFRHQLVSGKVEARRAITQPKMARREYTEKWTYKDWELK